MIRAAFTAALVCVAAPAAAQDARAYDGDGLHLDGVKVRLWGIDAPELHQSCKRAGEAYPCGQAALDHLAGILNGAAVSCEGLYPHGDRQVSRCTADGQDVAALMVRAGHALDWPRFSEGQYSDDQEAAQDAQRGMWAGEFVPPWEWRRSR